MSAYLGTAPVSIKKALYRNYSTVDLLAKGTSVLGTVEDAIKDLFRDGKQGVWYDPSDKSTLFQDVAGTIPVTKDGDPIGLMKDKSGNGNHATQSVSAARPLYKTDGVLRWFDIDGMDDWFKTNYTPSSNWSSHVALNVKPEVKASFVFESYQTAANLYIRTGGAYLSPLDAPTANKTTRTEIVGEYALVTSSTAVGDNIGTVPLTIAARHTGTATSFYFSGGIFGLIVINGISSATEITLVEQYLATKSGVTL